jgi:hypothetical protein
MSSALISLSLARIRLAIVIRLTVKRPPGLRTRMRELQEVERLRLTEAAPGPVRAGGDKKIIHIHRFPADDAHYEIEVGLQADIGHTLDALGAAVDRRFEPGPGNQRIRGMIAAELERGRDDGRYPVRIRPQLLHGPGSGPALRR